MHAGTHTPWGFAHSQEQLDEGVLWVETVHHGGLLIEKTLARELLSAKARAIGMPWQDMLTFEQERAMAVVFYEHPEWYFWAEEELTKKLAEDLLHQFYPSYFLD